MPQTRMPGKVPRRIRMVNPAAAKIGRGAIVPPPILAPARTMSVRGTVDDGITFFGSTFVRRLKMTGFSSLEHLFPSCP